MTKTLEQRLGEVSFHIRRVLTTGGAAGRLEADVFDDAVELTAYREMFAQLMKEEKDPRISRYWDEVAAGERDTMCAIFEHPSFVSFKRINEGTSPSEASRRGIGPAPKYRIELKSCVLAEPTLQRVFERAHREIAQLKPYTVEHIPTPQGCQIPKRRIKRFKVSGVIGESTKIIYATEIFLPDYTSAPEWRVEVYDTDGHGEMGEYDYSLIWDHIKGQLNGNVCVQQSLYDAIMEGLKEGTWTLV